MEQCLKEKKPVPTRWSESLHLEWFGPNGRVLIEGAGFTCALSAARWNISDEAHQWSRCLKERQFSDFLDDEEENWESTDLSEPGGIRGEISFSLMVEAAAGATVRLGHALARASSPLMGYQCQEVVQGWKRARWSLAEASQNAGLASHLGSADLDWLKGLRGECQEMRHEIQCLIHDFEERRQERITSGDTGSSTPARGR